VVAICKSSALLLLLLLLLLLRVRFVTRLTDSHSKLSH